MNILVKKFIEFALGSGITLILGFISSPIITRLIMPDNYGKFSMFNTVTNLILVVVMVGLDQAYVRFFYEEDEVSRKKLLRESIKIPMIVNLFFSLILILFYKPFSKFIVGQYSFSVIIMLIIQNTLGIIGRFSLLVVRMQQKGKLYSVLQVITKLTYIVGVLSIFSILGNNYNTLILALILSNLICVIWSIFTERDEWFSVSKEIKLKTSNKELVVFGAPLIFSMAITWIFQSMDKFFIKAFNGYIELGLYSAAFTIIALLNAVQGTFTTFWVPVANEKYVENPKESKRFFSKVNLIVSFGMLIIAIGIITFKDLLILLLGPKYRQASNIFPFLVFMPIMYTISETTVLGISFKKKNKNHIYIAIISALVNLMGNIILVPGLGAKGAAISTGVSYIVFFTARTLISKRLYYVDYNLRKFYISTILVTVLALYASFNTSMLLLILLGIVVLIIVCFIYREILILSFKYLENKFLKGKYKKKYKCKH
ncbi:lipopolysaccharide biosynthesis protein [Clostridium perfringens]|uniref:lipopolysaccharide biosynthesis protein n=1 Tax=Clostridium perfringens TaxID=1502 RepID=UPI001ABA29C4|nr:oligosaccharide flippase family protein [Clostridium perfringens]ELC8348638.1 oligosaccharide flippase family protein [Clostridium perfringens]ELC8351304.1 oligosaccharide flippase family protein [Clostridium perfringens]ELC8352156.1 oligosaccharide flippase family protein [Clostridium perfringens]MBO3369215.1 oligosaccharide flippase family protein [Clostridium perfringens]